MSSVHRLQHVEGFLSAHLAHDYPVRPHAQCVDDQFALTYGSLPLHVRGPAFKPNNVLLLQLEFGRVLDGDDTFRFAYISAEAVSYTHLRAHETDSYLVCRLLLEKK